MDDLTEEEAREFLQSVIDYAEGRTHPNSEEKARMALTLVARGMALGPMFVEMCGSEEKATERLAQMYALTQMGEAASKTTQ